MAAPTPDEMTIALFVVKYGNYFWTGMLAFLGFIFLIRKGKRIEGLQLTEKQMRNEMQICALKLENKQDAKYFKALEAMKLDILREIKLMIEASK